MRKVTIDLRYAQNKDELHEGLSAGFHFPDYYGRNLDALYDMLTQITEDTCMLVMLPSSAVLTDSELDGLDAMYEDAFDDDDADDWSDDADYDEEEEAAEWSEFIDYVDRMHDTFADAEHNNPHLCIFLP